MKTALLGDICDIQIGGTPSRADSLLWDKDKQTGNVWVSIADLKNTDGIFINDSKEYVSDKARLRLKLVKKGTLLVSFKLTIGRLAFAGKDLFTNEAIAALTIKNEKEIDKNYLYHYLKFFDWEDLVKGEIKVKGKTLNKAKLKLIKFTYPESIEDQKRIVKKLDKAFEKIDKAIELTKKNFHNSQELFKSELFSLIKNSDGPELSLSSFLTLNYGKPLDRKDRDINGKYNVYGANGVKDKSNKYYWDRPSIILGRKGSAGEISLTKGPFWPLDVTYFVSHDTKITDINFLYLLLKTLNLKSLAKGVKPGINRSDVYKIMAKLPKIEEQKQIASKLTELSLKTLDLQKLYRQKLDGLEELRQSILKQAFEGKL